jgi:hypothetical protein
MKTTILSVLFTLILFANNLEVQAKTYAPIQYSIYSVQNELTFRLTIQNEETKVIQVNIYTENGVLVYSDKITKAGTSVKLYDMTSQGAGVYKVELAVNGFKSIETIKVGATQAQKTIAGKLLTDFSKEIEKNAEKDAENNLSIYSENDLIDFIEANSAKQE